MPAPMPAASKPLLSRLVAKLAEIRERASELQSVIAELRRENEKLRQEKEELVHKATLQGSSEEVKKEDDCFSCQVLSCRVQ